jgi:hypothetical protein
MANPSKSAKTAQVQRTACTFTRDLRSSTEQLEQPPFRPLFAFLRRRPSEFDVRKPRFSLRRLAILSLGAACLTLGIEEAGLLQMDECGQLKLAAAHRTKAAFVEIRKAKLERGVPIEPEDLAATGMIGPEFTPLVTTLGSLSAKRTAANPDFAGVIVGMLLKSGV